MAEYMIIVHNILHDICKAYRQFIGILVPERNGHTCLCVCINQKHFLIHTGKSGSEIDCCGRLSNSTFLITY